MMMAVMMMILMMITSVWFVGVVPKAAIIQDKVEGSPVVVSVRQEIFPEIRFPANCVGNFQKANCVGKFMRTLQEGVHIDYDQ